MPVVTTRLSLIYQTWRPSAIADFRILGRELCSATRTFLFAFLCVGLTPLLRGRQSSVMAYDAPTEAIHDQADEERIAVFGKSLDPVSLTLRGPALPQSERAVFSLGGPFGPLQVVFHFYLHFFRCPFVFRAARPGPPRALRPRRPEPALP